MTTVLFDNVAWVNQHAQQLSSLDPQVTFRHVIAHHPLRGCASNEPPSVATVAKISDLSEIAKYADAVTVCCYEVCGTNDPTISLLASSNATAAGNMAFIAQNHSNAAVRAHYTNQVAAWCRMHAGN